MVIDQSRPMAAGADTTERSAPPDERSASAGVIVAVLLLLAAGYALTILVFYPGYVTIDATYVYKASQDWRFGDWQSPAMSVVWWLIDPIAPGALSMFLLTATAYWLGFGLVALTAARRAAWLGLLTPLLALTPPAFMFVGMIWRDMLFAVTWLLAAALAFAVADRSALVRLPVQALALLLVAFGVLLRPNAIFAAALIAAYVIWPVRFQLKRIALLFVPAVIGFYALIPYVYYDVLGAERQNPLHSLLVFDLGGITHFSGKNQFPVSWSAEETALLTGTCYDPVRWDTYWHMPPCPFVMKRLERADDMFFGTPRLVDAWQRAVTTHPLAYLHHRLTYMRTFLAGSNLVLPYYDWRGPAATYGSNPYFKQLLELHHLLQPTVLFLHAFWLILAIGVCTIAWPARATAAGAFAVGVTASAIVYVTTFLVVGVAADFRYGYWCVLATLAAAVAALLAYCGPRAAPAP
jgi:hypothetical protein